MDGLIPRNATEAVKPPQVRREEMQPLSPEQVKVLLEAARNERLEALCVLAVTTGLRQGELLGLKWEDVDLEAGMLRVRRTLVTTKDGPQLAAPKTKGSRRTVRLTQSAVKALRSHLNRQLGEIDRYGGLLVAGEWSHIRFGGGRPIGPPIRNQPSLQAAPEASRAIPDTLPRPTAHMRHAASRKKRKP
jgi:integrase